MHFMSEMHVLEMHSTKPVLKYLWQTFFYLIGDIINYKMSERMIYILLQDKFFFLETIDGHIVMPFHDLGIMHHSHAMLKELCVKYTINLVLFITNQSW
jgi:hypothetical protein